MERVQRTSVEDKMGHLFVVYIFFDEKKQMKKL